MQSDEQVQEGAGICGPQSSTTVNGGNEEERSALGGAPQLKTVVGKYQHGGQERRGRTGGHTMITGAKRPGDHPEAPKMKQSGTKRRGQSGR